MSRSGKKKQKDEVTPQPLEHKNEKAAGSSPERFDYEIGVYREELRAQSDALVESQRLLEISRDRYADLYDFAPISYVTLEENGIIEEINLTGTEILEADRERLVGMPFRSFVHPEDRSRFLDHMRRCRQGKSPVISALRLKSRSGLTIPVQLSSRPSRHLEQGTVSYRTALTDLTERERIEQEIRRLNADLENRVRERTLELEQANTRLSEEVGQRRHAEQQLKEYALALEAANTALHKAYEDARAADRAKLESERAARTEAEKTNQLKDEFLATLSHELRTPLNAMLGWVQLIRAGRLETAEIERALVVIERNIRVQVQLVTDLLDMSRIISGKLSVDIQPVALPGVIASAIDSVHLSAEAAGITIEREVGVDVGIIRADPNRLAQVLSNLLSNAIKFSPSGRKVYVQARRSNGNIEVRVRDLGTGIRPDFLPYVFDRFRQADSSQTRRQGGLGIGLSIARHLIEAQGGTIRAQSEGEGKGATFILTLPSHALAGESAAEREEPGWVSPDSSAIRGVKVLVVDDDEDGKNLVGRQLQEFDAEVRLAGSCAEALRILQSFWPDVLVSDISMPDQDGYALIHKARAFARETGRELYAVALTAFARPEDKEQALQAGYQLHITKPVEMPRLATAVARLARRAAAGTPPETESPVAAPETRPESSLDRENLHILVVDNEADSAGYLKALLELCGHRVTTASDGTSAIDLALRLRPDLVLLDIGLPDIDGYEVAFRLSQSDETRNTKLVAVSGYEKDYGRGHSARFDAYLTKPVEPDTLATLIRQLGSQADE
jgi:PAS domain S-box-containing protein